MEKKKAIHTKPSTHASVPHTGKRRRPSVREEREKQKNLHAHFLAACLLCCGDKKEGDRTFLKNLPATICLPYLALLPPIHAKTPPHLYQAPLSSLSPLAAISASSPLSAPSFLPLSYLLGGISTLGSGRQATRGRDRKIKHAWHGQGDSQFWVVPRHSHHYLIPIPFHPGRREEEGGEGRGTGLQ